MPTFGLPAKKKGSQNLTMAPEVRLSEWNLGLMGREIKWLPQLSFHACFFVSLRKFWSLPHYLLILKAPSMSATISSQPPPFPVL
jgi:hypothetical protein